MGKKTVKLLKFDAAKYLNHPETIAVYLSEALETGDSDYIFHALNTIARAKGMTNVAKETGLGRESLYKALGGTAKPEFETVRKVIRSFGMKLIAEPIEKERG